MEWGIFGRWGNFDSYYIWYIYSNVYCIVYFSIQSTDDEVRIDAYIFPHRYELMWKDVAQIYPCARGSPIPQYTIHIGYPNLSYKTYFSPKQHPVVYRKRTLPWCIKHR